MAAIAFGASHDDYYLLNNFTDSVIVRLALPVGSYIIVGKTVLSNSDGDQQDATARLTTMDGATELDRADIRITGMDGEQAGGQQVSLQAHLELTNDTADRIVDFRAQTFSGAAFRTKLYAIQLEGIKMSD